MHKCAQYARTLITYQWASCAAMFWNDEFTRFQIAKTKRLRRLLYVRIYPPLKNIFPRRGRIRMQRYKNILIYANGNAKYIQNISKKVRNLMESKGTANKYARNRRDYRRHLQSRCPDSIRT